MPAAKESEFIKRLPIFSCAYSFVNVSFSYDLQFFAFSSSCLKALSLLN